MDNTYTYIADLRRHLPSLPADTIISQSLERNAQFETILFGFAAGQELSEHTAAYAATLYFIEGEAELTLGAEKVTAGPGAWIHMPPHLPHSIQAKTATLMLLTLAKAASK